MDGSSKADAISSDLLSLGASVLDMIDNDDGDFDPSEELGLYWDGAASPTGVKTEMPELEQDFVERIIVLERKVRDMVADKNISASLLQTSQTELAEAKQSLEQMSLQHEGIKQQLKVQEEVARHFATQATQATVAAQQQGSQDQSKEVGELQAALLKLQQDHNQLLQKNTSLEQKLQKVQQQAKESEQASKQEKEKWEQERKRAKGKLDTAETRTSSMTKQLNRAKIELGKWVQQQKLERDAALDLEKRSSGGGKTGGRGGNAGGRRTPDQADGGRRTPDQPKTKGSTKGAAASSTSNQTEVQRQKKEPVRHKKQPARKKESQPEEDDFWGAPEEPQQQQQQQQQSKKKVNRVVQQQQQLESKMRQKNEAGQSGGKNGGDSNSRGRRNEQREKLGALGADEINKKKSPGERGGGKAARENGGLKFTVDLSKKR
jgi:hypothetical protein